MNNFVVRTITGVLFVAVVVTCFLKPLAMVGFFALVTGLSIWEFTGLVNLRENVKVNRFISTVAGVYLFLAFAGWCMQVVPSAAFVPYLITVVYLFISEIYQHNEDAINDWAYTMLSQMYVALPFACINMLAFRSMEGATIYGLLLPLSIFVFLWCNDTGAYISGSLLGKHKLFPRISPAKSWEGSIGGAVFVLVAAAIVGFSKGTGNSIENCVVTADVSGNEYVGGIVGHALNGSISLSGCAFSGLMTGGSNYMGAFIGWDDGGTKTATDCLYLIPVGQSTTNLDLVKEGGTLTVTNCCKTTYVGNYGMYAVYATTPSDLGALTHDYGMVKAYEGGILFDGKYYLATFPGTGTEADPYIIRDEDDWNAFAYYVNNGHNFNGKFVKLTNNISVTTMVGSSENISFQGTFLGNNQTLTFTKGSAEAAFSEENCAPFRFVKDATIQDLKVAGNIYTSRKFAVGLASRPYGTTNITNCHVSTNIYSTVNGDGTHGGFAAMPSGTLNIAGCAYTGRLLTNSGTNNCGGFVAWHNSATISVASSLYAPSGSIAEGWTAITGGETFVRGGSPTITDCYYTEPMGTAQGTQAYALADGREVTAQCQTADDAAHHGVFDQAEQKVRQLFKRQKQRAHHDARERQQKRPEVFQGSDAAEADGWEARAAARQLVQQDKYAEGAEDRQNIENGF